jgi:hypothetical protein
MLLPKTKQLKIVIYYSKLLKNRFVILTAIGIKVTVFWHVTPFNLVNIYQYFRETCVSIFTLLFCGENGGIRLLRNREIY